MSSPTQAKERLNAVPCSVARQRIAWLEFRKGSTHVTRRLKGNCVVCGHKESAAIHSYPFQPGRETPFHDYCPLNDQAQELSGGK